MQKCPRLSALEMQIELNPSCNPPFVKIPFSIFRTIGGLGDFPPADLSGKDVER
jgi:hypothetical protein